MGFFSSLFGGTSAADAARKAAREYIDELNRQRTTFLDQPESQSIRGVLGEYATGDYGFSPESVQAMRAGATEDYGRSLRDLKRLAPMAGLTSGNVYTPGNRDRTFRLLGENAAVRRAEAMRDITTRDEQQAQANARFAASALPTYLPGLSQTQIAGPGVYQQAHQQGPSIAGALLDFAVPLVIGAAGGGPFGAAMGSSAGMGSGLGSIANSMWAQQPADVLSYYDSWNL